MIWVTEMWRGKTHVIWSCYESGKVMWEGNVSRALRKEEHEEMKGKYMTSEGI